MATSASLERLERDDSAAVDVVRLARALRREVRGEGPVRAGTRELQATDASNYRQAPLGVVLPLDAAGSGEPRGDRGRPNQRRRAKIRAVPSPARRGGGVPVVRGARAALRPEPGPHRPAGP
jgi:hypothetical protein